MEVADSCGINAFVVDIMDGGAIAYPSEVMKQYSPSAYESAYNTLEVYQTGIKTLKDAGYYVIGRITAFNDPHLAEDHPECVIADQAGEPLQRSSSTICAFPTAHGPSRRGPLTTATKTARARPKRCSDS